LTLLQSGTSNVTAACITNQTLQAFLPIFLQSHETKTEQKGWVCSIILLPFISPPHYPTHPAHLVPVSALKNSSPGTRACGEAGRGILVGLEEPTVKQSCCNRL